MMSSSVYGRLHDADREATAARQEVYGYCCGAKGSRVEVRYLGETLYGFILDASLTTVSIEHGPVLDTAELEARWRTGGNKKHLYRKYAHTIPHNDIESIEVLNEIAFETLKDGE